MSYPTYDEFKHSQVRSKEVGYIVKTADSRLFIVENGKFIQSAVSTVKLLAYMGICMYILTKTNWPMLLIDSALIPVVFAALASRLLYRQARFRELEPDSSEFTAVKDEKFGKPLSRPMFVLMGIGLLILFLNSFTFTYLRSLIYDEARVTSVEVNNERFENINSETPSVIRIASDTRDKDYFISITTVCTPDKATLTVDDRRVDGKNFVPLGIFWSDEYFSQEYHCKLSRAGIHDGSVVTFERGSLVREWVLDLPD